MARTVATARFGQYCIVLPEQDAVIAITSGVRDMQAVLNLVWDKLLPALQNDSLPANDGGSKKLRETLAHLSLRPVEGTAAAAQVTEKKFVFPENQRKLESITLKFDDSSGPAILTARFNGVDQQIACGKGQWNKGRVAWGRFDEQPLAACGAWTEDGLFKAKLCFYETPFILTVSLKYSGNELNYDEEANVGFGPSKQPQLVGSAQYVTRGEKGK